MTDRPWQQAFRRLRDQFIEAQYQHLNPAQREAVLHVEGPTLVLAGAGSGKTTMLVNRIGHLIRFGPAYGNDRLPPQLTEERFRELESWMKLHASDATAPLPFPWGSSWKAMAWTPAAYWPSPSPTKRRKK